MSKDNKETKRVRISGTQRKVKSKSKNSKSKKVKFKDKHPKAAKAIRISILVFILVAIIGSGILVGAFVGIFGDELKIEESLLKVGAENSTVYDADGNLIATLAGDAKRKSITLGEMSEYLPKAYVAIEDERFYEHGGIDVSRTAYATVTYILNGGSSSFGGSTITQQVIKNITQEKERSSLAGVMRKVKEISKAIQVEQYLSKDQILELYLNLIFIGGEDINGVELGAIYYFNKSAKDLSIAECAYMAGINHSPNAYKPFSTFENKDNPEQAKKDMTEKINHRTKTVLGKMLEVGYITEEQHKTAIEEVNQGLKFERGQSAEATVDVSYHTAAAIEQLIDRIIAEGNEDMDRDAAELLLYSSGLKIYTTQKTDIQTILEEEITDKKYITSTKYMETVRDENGKPVKDEKGNTKKEEKIQYSTPTMVIINQETGEVVAAATATGDKETRSAKTKLGYFNYPVELQKQTGSSMKPLSVIVPGLTTGTITGATVYIDQPTTWGNGPKPYSPKNYDQYPRFFVNMRQAIEVSANIPHVKALSNIGTEAAVDFCESIGMPRFEAEGLSLALGGLNGGVSPTQMAAGYASIASGGTYRAPIFYTKVTDSKGKVLYEPEKVENRVMTEQVAYIASDILKQPVISGTATYCKIAGMDVAAKTGTTNGDLDRWLCGFTPYYTAACWYGYPVGKQVKFSGNNPAGQIWDNVMTAIHKELENKTFIEPEGIIRKTVCKVSGKLATAACGANVYAEVFTEELVPTTACEGHGQIRVCMDSKQMATSQCPNVLDTMGYIPEKERGAVWVTENALTTDITGVCPLHPEAAAPAPAPAPETNKTEDKKEEDKKPSGNQKPSGGNNSGTGSSGSGTGTGSGSSGSGTGSGSGSSGSGTTPPSSGGESGGTSGGGTTPPPSSGGESGGTSGGGTTPPPSSGGESGGTSGGGTTPPPSSGGESGGGSGEASEPATTGVEE